MILSDMGYINLDDCYIDVSGNETGYIYEIHYAYATSTSDLLGIYLATQDGCIYDYVLGELLYQVVV